jgi:hypothetical protein
MCLTRSFLLRRLVPVQRLDPTLASLVSLLELASTSEEAVQVRPREDLTIIPQAHAYHHHSCTTSECLRLILVTLLRVLHHHQQATGLMELLNAFLHSIFSQMQTILVAFARTDIPPLLPEWDVSLPQLSVVEPLKRSLLPLHLASAFVDISNLSMERFAFLPQRVSLFQILTAELSSAM